MRARTLLGIALVCLTLTASTVPSFASAASPSPWSLPWKVNAGGPAVTEIEVAAIPGGGVLAVWISPEASGDKTLYYSERLPDAGWQPNAVVTFATNLLDISLAMNSQGQGALVWTLAEGGLVTYASFYGEGTGFSAPAILNNYTYATAYNPVVAINEAGTAAALWFEDDGINVSAFVARGNASSALWGPAEGIESLATLAYPERSGIAVDGNGAAHAIWRQSDGGGYRAMTNSYTPLIGWGTAKPLDNGSGGMLEFLQVAALPDGRALALWTQTEWFTGAVPLVSTFAPARGWDSAPRQLNTSLGRSALAPALACGGAGTCLISWSESLGTHTGAVVTSTLDAGATFAPPQVADATLLGNGYYTDVAVGPAGDGLVVWAQDSEPPAGADIYSAYARAFDPVGGLAAPVRLDRISTQSVNKVQAAATAGGGVVGMWTQVDGPKLSAYVSASSPLDVVPPTVRITAPANSTGLTEGSAVVTGVADGATTVSVNGVLVLLRKDGTFQLRTPLAIGPNVIRATATDDAGNSAAATVNVTVLDPTAALSDELLQANQLIGWLLENQTRLDRAIADKDAEIRDLLFNITLLQYSLSLVLVNQSTVVYELGELRGQVVNATANASQAEIRAEQAQAEAASAHAAQNASGATAQTAGRSADSAQANASTAFLVGMVALVIGAGATLLSLVRRGGGGGGGGGGRVSIERQTPKRDFGDRMKAGLDTAGGLAVNEEGIQRTAGEGGSFAINEPGVHRDAASGQASGKRQHGAPPADEGIGSQGSDTVLRGPRQSTSVDGSYDTQVDRDAASGRETKSAVTSPRDAASGQASGKRQHGALPADEGIGSQGQDGVLRGPRQSTSVDGSYAPDAGRDAATGQASGKRVSQGDLTGDGRPDLAVNEEGTSQSAPPKKKPH